MRDADTEFKHRFENALAIDENGELIAILDLADGFAAEAACGPVGLS